MSEHEYCNTPVERTVEEERDFWTSQFHEQRERAIKAEQALTASQSQNQQLQAQVEQMRAALERVVADAKPYGMVGTNTLYMAQKALTATPAPLQELTAKTPVLPHKDGVIQLDRNNPGHREWFEDDNTTPPPPDAREVVEAAKELIGDPWTFGFAEGFQKVVYCRYCRGVKDSGHTKDCKYAVFADALAKLEGTAYRQAQDKGVEG